MADPGEAAHQGTETASAELFVPFTQGTGFPREQAGAELALRVVPEAGKRERPADPIKTDRKHPKQSQPFGIRKEALPRIRASRQSLV